MKFEKWLALLLKETFPEWRDRYISYTLLKKFIKWIEAEKNSGDPNGNCLDRYEAAFIRLVKVEVDKLNQFMADKSNDDSLRLQVLKNRFEKVKSGSGYTQGNANSSSPREEVILLGKDLVSLHGELVLLQNYSQWNYSGLRKILKKYHRRVRSVLGGRYIQCVRCQPCFATEPLVNLISECNTILHSIFSLLYGNEEEDHVGEIFLNYENENQYIVYKSSVAALKILNDMTRLNSVDSDDE